MYIIAIILKHHVIFIFLVHINTLKTTLMPYNDIFQDSHLSEWVGNSLTVFSSMDKWVMNLIICLIVAGATEVTSNTATATLLMPILKELVRIKHCKSCAVQLVFEATFE